jgi:Fe-S cluster assembly ATP-binding protein
MKALEIRNLRLAVNGSLILDNFSLIVPAGEVHALMGKNGIGKSSLAKAIAGCQGYEILGGDIRIDGESIVGKQPDEIARMGFFLAFQNPVEIPGVSVANFLRAAVQSRLPKGAAFNAVNFYKDLYEKMDFLQMDRSFSSRSLNDGFSGGEKKRCEILQMLMLEPRYAVLDETDSGLDVDALKIVSTAINSLRKEHADFSAVIITHHNRLLNGIKPDGVHIISDGKIVMSGGFELAEKLENFGYDFINGSSKA